MLTKYYKSQHPAFPTSYLITCAITPILSNFGNHIIASACRNVIVFTLFIAISKK